MNCLIADRADAVRPESAVKRIKNLKDYLSDLPTLTPIIPGEPKMNSIGGLLSRPKTVTS
jgi:hypothetical protein